MPQVFNARFAVDSHPSYHGNVLLFSRVKDEAFLKSVGRIITIWEERSVFEIDALTRFKASLGETVPIRGACGHICDERRLVVVIIAPPLPPPLPSLVFTKLSSNSQ